MRIGSETLCDTSRKEQNLEFIQFLKNNFKIAIFFILALVIFLQGLFYIITKKAIFNLQIMKSIWLNKKQSLALGILYLIASVFLFIYVFMEWMINIS